MWRRDGLLLAPAWRLTLAAPTKPRRPSISEWGAPAPTPAQPSASFYTFDYYARFFNVNTDQVGQRILLSVMPWKTSFLETVAPNPDLYGKPTGASSGPAGRAVALMPPLDAATSRSPAGPFWLATTVVFVLFVVGNMAGSLTAYQSGTDFTPNFAHLSLAATVVYCYVALAPIVLWLALKYLGAPSSLVQLWCLYGYALAVFVPVSVRSAARLGAENAMAPLTAPLRPCAPRARGQIICVIPVEGVKWAFSALAMGLSGARPSLVCIRLSRRRGR